MSAQPTQRVISLARHKTAPESYIEHRYTNRMSAIGYPPPFTSSPCLSLPPLHAFPQGTVPIQLWAVFANMAANQISYVAPMQTSHCSVGHTQTDPSRLYARQTGTPQRTRASFLQIITLITTGGNYCKFCCQSLCGLRVYCTVGLSQETR